MTTSLRTGAGISLALGVVLVALVAGAYTFRGQLANTPMVGAALDPDADGRLTDAMPSASEPGAGSPRAVVNIDPRRQQLIGVRTAPVERRSLTQTIRAVGTVRYDETRLADINVKVAGWIEKLYVDYTGQFIEPGQPLLTLYSPELLTTQQEYVLAVESRDRLRDSPIADARAYADRLVEAARQRLTLWDLPSAEIDALEVYREPQRTMPFRAPVGGYVIEKHAVQGMHVTPGLSLYRVADLSVVWVEADMYEEELSLVREGVSATVTVDAYPEDRIRGRVLYIYPYVEERTRTVRVRFAFPNERGRSSPACSPTSRWMRRWVTVWSCPPTPCSIRAISSTSSCRRATATSSHVRWWLVGGWTMPCRSSRDSRAARWWRRARRSSSTPRVSCARRSRASSPFRT